MIIKFRIEDLEGQSIVAASEKKKIQYFDVTVRMAVSGNTWQCWTVTPKSLKTISVKLPSLHYFKIPKSDEDMHTQTHPHTEQLQTYKCCYISSQVKPAYRILPPNLLPFSEVQDDENVFPFPIHYLQPLRPTHPLALLLCGAPSTLWPPTWTLFTVWPHRRGCQH